MNCNTSVYEPAACTGSNAHTRSFRVEIMSVYLFVCLFAGFPFKQKKVQIFTVKLMQVIFFSGEQPWIVGSTHDDGSTDDLRNVGN